jgi:hypothetical protein
MVNYRTTKPVSFPSGTLLALDGYQAAVRRHLLDPVEPGVYLARQPVTFKAGETVGLLELVDLLPAPEADIDPDDTGTDAIDRVSGDAAPDPTADAINRVSTDEPEPEPAKPIKPGKK